MKRQLCIAISGAILIAGFGQGCGSGGGGDESASLSSVSIDQKVLSILATNCANCHTAANQGGINYILDLNQLRTKGIVIDGQPLASKLYSEVASGDMPLSYDLSPADINTLRTWIESLDNTGPGGNISGTFTQVKAITDAKCVSCHNSNHQIPLTNFAQISATIWPGNPAASLLYDSVNSGRMPKNTAPLTSAQISIIEGWILSGALNN